MLEEVQQAFGNWHLHERFFVFCDFLKNGCNDFFFLILLIKCHKLLVVYINFNPNEINEEGVN